MVSWNAQRFSALRLSKLLDLRTIDPSTRRAPSMMIRSAGTEPAFHASQEDAPI